MPGDPSTDIVDIRELTKGCVQYPLGFLTSYLDGRIGDPKAGRKGGAIWTTSGTRTNFHSESGEDIYPRVFKVQMRPDPLAH